MKVGNNFFVHPLIPKIAPKILKFIFLFFPVWKKLSAPKIICRLKLQSIWHTLQVCTFKNKNSTPKKLKNWVYFLPTFCIFCIIWLFYVWRTSKNIITLFLELWQKFWYVTSIVLKKFFFVDFSTFQFQLVYFIFSNTIGFKWNI